MRILVVDDDLGSRLVAEATVQALGHECMTASDGDEAWRLVEELSPDVVVSDRAMPGLDGLELCRRIRSGRGDGYTYIVLVTSLSNPDDVRDGMRAGADDYVTKPLNPFDLEIRLLAASRVTTLHAQLEQARAELTHLATTDPLTGLRNRQGLTEYLDQQHALNQRYDRAYCVALGDVDHFKRYNDAYGHPAGDRVLREIAEVLRSGVRDVDETFRYGGEEFLLVLPEQEAAGALVVVERLLSKVRALGLEHRQGTPAGIVTMSFGIATCAPGRRLTTAALIGEADEALYAAKAAGRDRVLVAGTA
jgi:diguanylate cyclase (GGDEF)-like protein